VACVRRWGRPPRRTAGVRRRGGRGCWLPSLPCASPARWCGCRAPTRCACVLVRVRAGRVCCAQQAQAEGGAAAGAAHGVRVLQVPRRARQLDRVSSSVGNRASSTRNCPEPSTHMDAGPCARCGRPCDRCRCAGSAGPAKPEPDSDSDSDAERRASALGASSSGAPDVGAGPSSPGAARGARSQPQRHSRRPLRFGGQGSYYAARGPHGHRAHQERCMHRRPTRSSASRGCSSANRLSRALT
jgi:hypothetical protein